MSAVNAPTTARCVHCTWTSDHDRGDELQEIRSIHELIHPGGTVLVGEPDVDVADVEDVLANSSTNGGKAPAWSRDEIISAIQAWEREHGVLPTTVDWSNATASTPSQFVVKNRFGRWSDAIVAAGFERPARGGVRRTQAVPPPVAKPKGHSSGQKPAQVRREPAPAQPSGDTPEGTLTELAARVDELSARRSHMLAELDQCERELAEAVAALRSALEPLDLESTS